MLHRAIRSKCRKATHSLTLANLIPVSPIRANRIRANRILGSLTQANLIRDNR